MPRAAYALLRQATTLPQSPTVRRRSRIDPGLAAAYSYRGSSYSAVGEWERAIADFTRSIDLGSTFPAWNSENRCHRGNTFAQTGDYYSSIADYARQFASIPTMAKRSITAPFPTIVSAKKQGGRGLYAGKKARIRAYAE